MAEIDYNIVEKGKLQLIIRGRLNSETTAKLWKKTVNKVAKVKPHFLEVQASQIDYCDGSGIGLLLELKRIQQENQKEMQIVGLKPDFEQLMELFDTGRLSKPLRQKPLLWRVVEQMGKASVDLCREQRAQINLTGEVSTKLLVILRNPRSFRLKNALLIAERCGADALGVTALLGFLIGLILAFQSTIAMKTVGAEIYVVNLVVLSLFRELGPLLTAFVMASRSGSAFAAEIGTMKVNEEIDALTTMGIDRIEFLVIPRVLVGIFVAPLLTLFHNLFGLIGCAVVTISIGFAPIIFLNQLKGAAGLTDLASGLIKTFVFGALIAGIGCFRGLETRGGASDVGESATRAVVSSIVAIVIADGVFAVIYYILGI